MRIGRFKVHILISTMSKKKQRNGFFYFMLDMQQELKYQGRNVAMKDMPLFAGPSWSKLSDAQKQRYNMRAKQEKSNGVQTTSSVASSEKQTPGRRDCLGNLISVSVLVRGLA